MNDIPSHMTTAEEDATYERVILDHVLQVHPVQLTMEELIREVTTAPDDQRASDGVQRAVRELTSVGLMRMNGDCVLPTHATVRLNELWDIITQR
jgi:hypothetical protein